MTIDVDSIVSVPLRGFYWRKEELPVLAWDEEGDVSVPLRGFYWWKSGPGAGVSATPSRFQSPCGDSIGGKLNDKAKGSTTLRFQSPCGDSIGGKASIVSRRKPDSPVSVPLRGFYWWKGECAKVFRF
ncbi:hypothetical protein [Funiculus sociatus]|uniref:hypothetical protein n=1 Tax=Funiculus sociatus TaxID=450527 RepID=UPI003D654774